MNLLDKITAALSWRISQIAQAALVLVMIIIVVNIIMRRFWVPLPGTVELVEILGAVILGLGLAYCQYKKGHIFVSILVKKFPLRVQALVDAFTSLLALIFSSFLSWQLIKYAARMTERGYATGHLDIPIGPFIYIVGIGCIMLAIVLLRDFIKSAAAAAKGSGKK